MCSTGSHVTDEQPIYASAIAVASHLHRNQYRMNGEPYILHSLRVADQCEGEIIRSVAVLHDTIEDTGVLPGDLARLILNGVDGKGDCGKNCSTGIVYMVTRLVDALSNVHGRHQTYQDYIKSLTTYSDNVSSVVELRIVLRVKELDLVDNLQLAQMPDFRLKCLGHVLAKVEKYTKALREIRSAILGNGRYQC